MAMHTLYNIDGPRANLRPRPLAFFLIVFMCVASGGHQLLSQPSGWTQNGPTRIATPNGFTPPSAVSKSFSTGSYQLKIYASAFAQGNAMYLELRPHEGEDFDEDMSIRGNFAGRVIYFHRTEWGFRGFTPIAPLHPPGDASIQIMTGGTTYRHAFQVAKTDWPVYRSQMDLGDFSDAGREYTSDELALIQRANVRKRAAFALRTANMIDSMVAHPRDEHRITSPFYAIRVIERYRMVNGQRQQLEPKRNVHRGLDLRGVTGAPIYALLSGKVVIAMPMFFEGKATFIDHGAGILSVFMHQSELLVEEGQIVKAGDLIGKAGATGMVTGAHLHVSVYMQGVPVQPLSFLSLPIRD